MRWLRWFALSQFLYSDTCPVYIRQKLMERIQREKPDLYKELEQTGVELRRQLEQSQKTQKQ
jgi:hypothetical protein